MVLLKTGVLLLLFFLILPAFAPAQSGYTPPGLYDVERHRLDNGFQVLLKQRNETKNVAFRLVVNVGTRHFDCALRETPHLLEHLLFSGTSRQSESELEHQIADLGGSWNAVTGTGQTIFQLDIFDRYALQGFETLHEILTDTVITPEKIDKAKKIVYREEGGRPGVFRRFLYGAGIGKKAWQKANEWLLPGSGGICAGLVNMDAITEEHILNAYRTAYVPENMTLVAVGNFNRKKLLERINTTFGRLSRGEKKPALNVTTPPDPPAGPAAVSSTLSPFLGSNGSFSVAFRTAGREHTDAAPLIVLSSYLNMKFYELIRVKAGLSYAPETQAFFQPDYGIFYVTADVSNRNFERVRELMIGMLERLRSEKVAPDEVERTKRTIMLKWAHGYETNSGFASLYSDWLNAVNRESGLRSGERPHHFLSYADEIEAVTAGDLDRVVALHLQPERRIDIRSMPTVSYAEFFAIIGGLCLAIATTVVCRVRKAQKRRKSMLPIYLRRG